MLGFPGIGEKYASYATKPVDRHLTDKDVISCAERECQQERRLPYEGTINDEYFADCEKHLGNCHICRNLVDAAKYPAA